jgi:hypothetical protein
MSLMLIWMGGGIRSCFVHIQGGEIATDFIHFLGVETKLNFLSRDTLSLKQKFRDTPTNLP